MGDGVSQDECYQRMSALGDKMDEILSSQGKAEGMFEGIAKDLKEGRDTVVENRQNILDLTTKVGELRGGLVWSAWCWVKRRFNGGG